MGRSPPTSSRRTRKPPGALTGGPELLSQRGRQGAPFEPPRPVPRRSSRCVQARLAPEPEHVLHGNDREAGARSEGELDQLPVRLGLVPAAGAGPTDGRVVVVRAGVNGRVLGVILEPVRTRGRAGESEL